MTPTYTGPTVLYDADGHPRLILAYGSWRRRTKDARGLPELDPVEDQAAAWREAREMEAKP